MPDNNASPVPVTGMNSWHCESHYVVSVESVTLQVLIEISGYVLVEGVVVFGYKL